MNVIVCLDIDGHFHTANLKDRDEVWNLITDVIRDGDLWENRENADEYPDDLDYLNLDEDEWVEFVESFEERGVLEILPVKQRV